MLQSRQSKNKPAPTTVWISSINKIICPFEAVTSLRTAFSLSSKSPRNLAPASNEPISSEINCKIKIKFCNFRMQLKRKFHFELKSLKLHNITKHSAKIIRIIYTDFFRHSFYNKIFNKPSWQLKMDT